MKQVMLSVVVYPAPICRQQCRATIWEGNFSLIIEYETWETLFKMLDHKQLQYEIPDEIEVIVLDENFKPLPS